MENQHRKIVGYHELTQEDIDLMNQIKEVGRELLHLQETVVKRNKDYADNLYFTPGSVPELDRLEAAEPARWAAIARTDIQTGVMALVRAVAQPTDC